MKMTMIMTKTIDLESANGGDNVGTMRKKQRII